MSATAVGWAIGVGLACAPLLLLETAPWLLTGRVILEFDTVDVFYRSVADRFARGQVPYRDFLLEYPIGCLPQILLPRLAGGDLLAYRAAYIAEMLLANALLVLAIAREVERRGGPAAVPRRLGWYLLCYLFLGRLIASRLDVVPTLLAFLAAAEWSGGRPARGGVLAAAGGLVKLFPALAVVPGTLRDLAGVRLPPPRGLIAFAVVFGIGMAGWGLLGGPGLLDAILFHAGRGLEIESVGAGLLMLVSRLSGTPLALETGHGSVEIDGAWSPSVIVGLRYVQGLALAATLWTFVRRGRRDVVACTGGLILAFIATAPVLSPQFLIWALPFVLVLDGPAGRRARPLFVATCALTFLIYPLLFLGALLPMRMAAILVLDLRNAMIIALWAIVAVGAVGGRGARPVEVDDRPAGS